MTVDELAEYLEALQAKGLGDFKVVARVWADVCLDYEFEICTLRTGESINECSVHDDDREVVLYEDPRSNRRRV